MTLGFRRQPFLQLSQSIVDVSRDCVTHLWGLFLQIAMSQLSVLRQKLLVMAGEVMQAAFKGRLVLGSYESRSRLVSWYLHQRLFFRA